MKRPRPYIPIKVKIAVAERQIDHHSIGYGFYLSIAWGGRSADQLDGILRLLASNLDCAVGDLQLDHDPALILRPFNERTGKYTPDANDPVHLVWREKRAHLEKTIGRRADAERTVTTKGSDIWLKSKFKRLEGPPRKKAKIQSRGFPQGQRKMRAK